MHQSIPAIHHLFSLYLFAQLRRSVIVRYYLNINNNSPWTVSVQQPQ